MQYLLQNDLTNEAINGYFAKVVNMIVRKRGEQFLGFINLNR